MTTDNCETEEHKLEQLLSSHLFNCVPAACSIDNLRYQQELRKLEQLNLLGQMTASIAQEIRDPLQTVKGFLQLLQFKEGILPYQSHFSLMIDELNRANQIITKFLSLSRTKPTNLKLHNINDLINNVLPFIEAQAIDQDKLIYVEQNVVADIMLDEDEIKQVILNLVRNALEASPCKESIKIISQSNQTSVSLIVCDNGTGIPPEQQDNIGIPFFTTKKNGTGLGISISLSILERHQAKLDFMSDEKGTTFRVSFPIYKPGLK